MTFDFRSFDWSPISDSLAEVLSVIREPLENAGLQRDVAEVQELLDVGEYGLALEVIASLVRDHRLPLSPRAYELIERAGSIMVANGGDLDPVVWEELRPLIAG